MIWRLGARGALVVALLLGAAGSAFAQTAEDYDIAGGHFYTQAGGFGVRDLFGVRFWSEYQRYGGPATLGFPISRGFYGPGGFLYQAFQRALLQWHPELDAALPANTMEMLEPYDDYLLQVHSIPRALRPQPGTFDQQVAERLSWLTNPELSDAYLTNPLTGQPWSVEDATNHYGLPQSLPERRGPFVVQRFQRIPLQLWVDPLPGLPPPGTVVGVLSGEIAKEVGLIPRDAATPELPPPPLSEVLPSARPGPPTVADGTYQVQPGDTLSAIASQLYEDAGRWPVLFSANRDLLGAPEDLRAGMVIRVPGGVIPPVTAPPGQPQVLQEK